MKHDIGILTLASTIRELVDAREEASAKVAEIDAVLDDCRKALGVAPVTIAGVKVEDVAVALAAGARRCKCGKVFTPPKGAPAFVGDVCSRACYDHQEACRKRDAARKPAPARRGSFTPAAQACSTAARKPAPVRQAPVTATIAAPVKVKGGTPLCKGCGKPFTPQRSGTRGGRRSSYCGDYCKRKAQNGRARGKVDVDVPVVLRAKNLGRGTATHDVVWNGGPGLSSAVGHSSLHGTHRDASGSR